MAARSKFVRLRQDMSNPWNLITQPACVTFAGTDQRSTCSPLDRPAFAKCLQVPVTQRKIWFSAIEKMRLLSHFGGNEARNRWLLRSHVLRIWSHMVTTTQHLTLSSHEICRKARLRPLTVTAMLTTEDWEGGEQPWPVTPVLVERNSDKGRLSQCSLVHLRSPTTTQEASGRRSGL